MNIHRFAAPLTSFHGITSPGGLVHSGGYLTSQRSIDIKSRHFPSYPIEPSKVGGAGPTLPKGMA